MENPRILITGGAGGLGQALSRVFATGGWEVFAPGRDELNVTSEESVRTFFEKIKTLDLLINNAGLTRDVPLSRMTSEDWDEVMDVNLKGAFLCSRAALRLFPRERGGHILNIGSFSAKSPPVGQANYAAAKAGLIGLTQSLAREYGKRNIRVNLVMPGFLETRMTAGLSENARQRILERHVLGRFNTVEDAARFVFFLEGMKQVSGQVFQLDSRI